MVMHFTAGICIGMATVLVWQYFFNQEMSIKKAVWTALVFTLAVGLSWEIFELYFELTFFSDGVAYVTDTSSDLILDLCGGLLGAIYAHRIVFK